MREYHDSYLRSDVSLLVDVFESCRKICMNYNLQNFFGSWISVASSFKKTGVELDLLTDTDMLLMLEKGIRGEICHAIVIIQNLIANT